MESLFLSTGVVALAETLEDFMAAILGRNGGGLKAAIGSLMSKYRRAFEQQAQRLPVDAGDHPESHQRQAHQPAPQRRGIEGLLMGSETQKVSCFCAGPKRLF